MFGFIYDTVITGGIATLWYYSSEIYIQVINVYLQWQSPSDLKDFNKQFKVLNYKFKGSDYKVLIRIKRGPSKIDAIYDEEGDDVTDIIKSFMGPNEDFHGILSVITSEMLGYNSLMFKLADETVREFDKNTPIYI